MLDVKQLVEQYNKDKLIKLTSDPSPPTKTIHCYCRVSTKQQRDYGHSIEAQRSAIQKYITDNNLDGDVKWYSDAGISGTDFKTREQFNAMRSSVIRGDVVISYSLSRLGRHTKDILVFTDELSEKGVELVLLQDKVDTSTATGKAFYSMLAVMGTLERDLSIERSKTVIDSRKKEGYTVGKPPFGFDADKTTKKLIINEDEVKVISLIAGWIHDNPSIKDAEIVRKLQSLMDMGEIKIRNCKRVYQSYIHKIIVRNNLRCVIDNNDNIST